MNIKRGLSDDKNGQGLQLTSTNFPLVLVLIKFLPQLITDSQNQLKSMLKIRRCSLS